MSIVQDSGLEVIRKSAEDLGSSEYALRVRLPSASQTATEATSQLLYELRAEFEKLNKSLSLVIKHLSLITEAEIEEE